MKNVSVCTFKTSPFVPAPRAHMFQHVCAWCRYTRGRFERTHGDVLSGHTGVSACHTLTHTHINTHNTTQHNTLRPQHHTTTERDRERQRQRQRERDRERDRQTETETETETERETGTETETDRDRESREERRFIFSVVVRGLFFVDVVICLVNPVCARDLSLPNSVQ